MNAPLSGKQKRESMKFLLDQLRDTAAFRKEQGRKDLLTQQQMQHKDQTQQAKLSAMDVPPKMGKPTNPEAGPSDTVPAMLTPGEAVIPKKAAQNPKNKPIIKALVKEGRSDKELSVPRMGLACGTTGVKGYSLGSTEVESLRQQLEQNNIDTNGWSYGETGAINPSGELVPYTTARQDLLNSKSQYVPVMDPNQIENIGLALDEARSEVSTLEKQNKGGRGNAPDYADKLEAARDKRSALQNYYEKEMGWLDAGVPQKAKPMGLAKTVPAVVSPNSEPITEITPEESKQYFTDIPKQDNTADSSTQQTPEIITELGKYGSGTMAGDVPELSKEEAKGYIGKETKIPTDKSGFDKWTGFVGDAIKGAYDSISDPEKLKGALSSTLDTLGFNSRDAARFALLVAGSKALGYDNVEAVRYAGRYTLASSDKRAESEAATNKELTKSLIAKGYVYNSAGQLVAPPPKTTGMSQLTIPAGFKGAGTPINFIEKTDIHGDKSWVTEDGRTRSQVEKQYGTTLVNYDAHNSKEGIAGRWTTWEKEQGDKLGKLYEQRIPKPEKNKTSPILDKLPSSATIAEKGTRAFSEWGYNIDDPDQKRAAALVINSATEQMIKEAKDGKEVKTPEFYIHRNILTYKTGINQDLFKFDNGKKETPANLVTEQYHTVKASVMRENPKATNQQIEDKTLAKYSELKDQWEGNKTELTKSLTEKQRLELSEKLKAQYLPAGDTSGFYNFVKANIK